MFDVLVARFTHRDWSVGVVSGQWNIPSDTSCTEHFTTFPAMELKEKKNKIIMAKYIPFILITHSNCFSKMVQLKVIFSFSSAKLCVGMKLVNGGLNDLRFYL